MAMFEIFIYHFRHYTPAEVFPLSTHLAHKLSSIGFENEDISEALKWFSSLQQALSEERPAMPSGTRSLRIYEEDEEAYLSAECRGFLLFLEQSGALEASTRELIIAQALALTDVELTLARFKVIVLMVLWSDESVFDTLLLEDLLCTAEEKPWH